MESALSASQMNSGPPPPQVTLTPSSPPSPSVRKPNRRSSIVASRRLSRASGMGGNIPLGDLLATVPSDKEATVEQRLDKLVSLCVNCTIRQVETEVQESEGQLDQAALEVGRALRQTGFGQDVLENVADQVKRGFIVKSGEEMGEKRKKVLEYTAKVKEETSKWLEVKKERKEQMLRADRIARQAARGEISIGDDQKFNLSHEERSRLDLVPDHQESLDYLKKHRNREELLVLAAATKAKKLKIQVEDVDAELADAARDLIRRADQAGGRLESECIDDLL